MCYGGTTVPYYYEQFIKQNKADDEIFDDISIDEIVDLIVY